MNKLTVASVLWQGNFRGRNYHHGHVKRLEQMCRKWISEPFEFVCLTNAPSRSALYKQIPLNHPDLLPGWWAKLELFMGRQLSTRVLFLDLDNFICGPLDDIIHTVGGPGNNLFFAPPLGKPSTNPAITRGVITKFQSSVIVWCPQFVSLNDCSLELLTEAVKRFRGDQDFLGDYFKGHGQTYPTQWFMKLKDCWESGPPPGVKVVFGHPKPLWDRAEEKKWVQELLK